MTNEQQEIEQYQKKLERFAVNLLAPHGLRKYYILEKLPMRYKLARDWELARRAIPRGLAWLVENTDVEPTGS
jgi:hypothetical protein